MTTATGKEIAKANKWESMPVGSDELRSPIVHLDVTPAQLKGLDIGAEVEITLKGKVRGVHSSEHDSNLEIVIQALSVNNVDNEFKDLVD